MLQTFTSLGDLGCYSHWQVPARNRRNQRERLRVVVASGSHGSRLGIYLCIYEPVDIWVQFQSQSAVQRLSEFMKDEIPCKFDDSTESYRTLFFCRFPRLGSFRKSISIRAFNFRFQFLTYKYHK